MKASKASKAGRRAKLGAAAVAIGLALVFAYFLLCFAAALVLQRKLPALLAGGCPTCQLHIGSASVSLWRRRVSLNDVWFYSGDPKLTAGEVTIPSLEVDLSLSALLHKVIFVQRVLAVGPEVVITEGDGHSMPEPGDKEPSPWSWAGRAVQVRGAKFAYRRVYPRQTATIGVSQIDAEVTDWDSRTPKHVTEGRALGLLEESGRFDLRVAAAIFAPRPLVNVQLRMKSFHLADFNAFTKPSSGVELAGELRDADSNVDIHGVDQETWVKAKYEKLQIHFQKTSDRGSLKAFLFNLVGSLYLKHSDVALPRTERVRGVSLHRLTRESVVSFVIRGLRAAAFRIATQK